MLVTISLQAVHDHSFHSCPHDVHMHLRYIYVTFLYEQIEEKLFIVSYVMLLLTSTFAVCINM